MPAPGRSNGHRAQVQEGEKGQSKEVYSLETTGLALRQPGSDKEKWGTLRAGAAGPAHLGSCG